MLRQIWCYIRTGHTFDEGPGRYNATCFHCSKKNPRQLKESDKPLANQDYLLTGEIGDQLWLPPHN